MFCLYLLSLYFAMILGFCTCHSSCRSSYDNPIAGPAGAIESLAKSTFTANSNDANAQNYVDISSAFCHPTPASTFALASISMEHLLQQLITTYAATLNALKQM